MTVYDERASEGVTMEYGAEKTGGRNVSKAALLVGAAGLFLFIVGVKRKHRLDAAREVGEAREGGEAARR